MSAGPVERPSRYEYTDGRPSHTHDYLRPGLHRFLAGQKPGRLFEVGCGNGAMAASMHELGFDVVAIDSSESGIAQARAHHPGIRFEVGSAYDDLATSYGRFPVVVSLEVIEHLYDPRKFAARVFDLLAPGGVAYISTPYHGYFKNLALALSGRMDGHFTALWDGGHSKFWSMATLATLLREAGFVDLEFERVGRIPILAKSLVAIARKPAAR
jgi:2-polyprenyl-6-hydroxyphenyl methylase/3-demethylubiquinone-9 3-methyltransferase